MLVQCLEGRTLKLTEITLGWPAVREQFDPMLEVSVLLISEMRIRDFFSYPIFFSKIGIEIGFYFLNGRVNIRSSQPDPDLKLFGNSKLPKFLLRFTRTR